MDDAWPPPSNDDLPYGGRRGGPNYALRRGIAALVVAAVLGTAGYLVLRRDSEGDAGSDDGAITWDVVVVQQGDGTISVHDRDGEEVATAETDLVGVDDIGLAGAVVVGLDGEPSVDGLALVDLDTGDLTDLDVSFDDVRRLGDSSLLVAADTVGNGLELIVAADERTIDLVELTDRDDPLVDPDTVRVDDAGAFVAFNELRSFETVVVDVAAGTGASLPGSLADLAFERVLTITNRGDTVLLDLSETSGTRVGTVETPPVRAAMLVDATTAIVVTAEGVVSSIDFSDETVDEVVQLGPLLPVPPGTDPTVDTDIVERGVALADRTRLALFGERFVAFLDATGALVRSVDVAASQQPFFDPTGAERCLAVGRAGGPYTLLDSSTGAIVTAFGDGTLLADSADGCIVALAADGTADDVVAGLEIEVAADATLLALSPDGSAAVQSAVRSVTVVTLDADDAEPLEVLDARAVGATFARR